MKNHLKKRRLYTRCKGRYIRQTAEDRAWLNMMPVGREFGSKNYERFARIDALVEAAKLNEIHPGEILLKEFIESRGISAEQCAETLGWPINQMMRFVQGIEPVTDDIALSLGRFFDMDAQFWLNLQAEYDRRKS